MTPVRSTAKWVSNHGLECYLLVKKKKISITACCKLIENGDLSTIKDKVKKLPIFSEKYYESKYTKLDCIDEVLDYSNNKYQHLRQIRDIVLMEPIVNTILDNKTYKKNLSFYYAKEFFNILFATNDNLRLLYSPYIEKEKLENFHSIMNKIDNYYINIITK